jgi:nucleoside-diphosphate-sugar epimerase
MKRVLVTGAGGMVGYQVIRFLLSEGKYDITVLDLKTKLIYKKLKNFRKRVNIVYGDVNDIPLVDSLVKDSDVVIHLAGIIPPMANLRDDLCEQMDYGGTKTICNAIKRYNPDCHLLYASSTSVYGKHDEKEKIIVKSELEYDSFDYYSKYKVKCEEYIRDAIKNYTIFRLAYVLGDPKKDAIIYNVNMDSNLETISAEDAGYAFVCSIDNLKSINGKTYNLSGGDKFRTKYSEFIVNILRYYGLSFRFLGVWLFSEKNYYGGYYEDGDKLEEILNFRSKNLSVYYETLEKYKSKLSRKIPRLLAIPFILKYKKK